MAVSSGAGEEAAGVHLHLLELWLLRFLRLAVERMRDDLPTGEPGKAGTLVS